MKIQLTAVFQKVPEGYIGFVEELPGANTQAPTLEEARVNLQEANLREADLNGANLAGADLSGAEMSRYVKRQLRNQGVVGLDATEG